MTQETKEAIIRGLKNDLADAGDNLYRAKAAFGKMSDEELDGEYGQSGETCREILRGYQEWHDKAQAALDEAVASL